LKPQFFVYPRLKTVLDKQKIAAPKKNSTFALGFLISFFENLKLLNLKEKI